jgi:hypothetical protein
MWQKTSVSGYSQANAASYCSSTATTGGYHDWRLPTVIELVSITDYGVTGESLPGELGGAVWSSTMLAGSSSRAWCVRVYDGATQAIDLSSTISVLCVR